MYQYFRKTESIYAMNGGEVVSTLQTMAYRYLGSNPAFPLTYRAYNRDGILRDSEFRYKADFNKIFPTAKNRQRVYAWTSYPSPCDGSLRLDLNCISPTALYVNGVLVFKSTIFEERYPEKRQEIEFPVQAGDNSIIVEVSKTPAGFGMLMGTWLGKFNLYFNAPSKEREGQEGFIYTKPLDTPLENFPVCGMRETETGIEWFPASKWENENNLSNIYSDTGYIICYTKIKCTFKEQYLLDIHTNCNYKIYLNNELQKSDVISVSYGVYDLVCVVSKNKEHAFFHLKCDTLQFLSPCNIWGSDEKWIYAGVFEDEMDIREAIKLKKPLEVKGGKTFWRLSEPGMFIRPYNENALYGEWNYPLGVTVYGLLSTAKALGLGHISDYVKSHVLLCCDTFDYAIWDRKTYGGGTSIHNLLASIDSLDDCGSFGSAMLECREALALYDEANIIKIADYVADYIRNKQVRLENGVFFRKYLMHIFHEDTLWADDLYMSIPFLIRYYKLTSDETIIDDCVNQIFGFRDKLYMEDQKLMSHVYDFKFNCKTGVPWGRGNGWVIFTLSELLEAMPENHEKKVELTAFFKELCQGYLSYQDEYGMWHQVVNDHSSYMESSCTAMFIYAFSKGLLNGFISGNEYINAVFKGFSALTKYAVDKNGNLYGVCRGSEFSYNADYYKYELLPRLNDTHGIGIVLLAGTEVLKLEKYLMSISD